MAQSLEAQLAKILKTSNGKTIRQNLEEAVRYLYKCLDNHILEYYLSYSPTWYDRTFDFQNSLYAEDFVHARVKNNRIELSVSFRPSMAYHWNLWDTHKSYVPLLINCGWYSRKLEERIGYIPRFTRYEGYHFVEKAIAQFNRTNHNGVYIAPSDVEALWEGQDVSRGFDWRNISGNYKWNELY